jgi:hypothetical protein
MKSLRDEKLSELREAKNFLHVHTSTDFILEDEEYHKNKVIEDLSHYIGNNHYSDLFLHQMEILNANGYITIKYPFMNKIERAYYSYDDILFRLRSIINGEYPNDEKAFNKINSFLKDKNLFHIHHNPMNYININIARFFHEKYPTEEVLRKELEEIDKKYNKPINEIMQILALRCITGFSQSPDISNNKPFRITGEWLIYQKKNNKYNFIGLYLHTKNDKYDQNLYQLIQSYLLQEYMP